MREIGPTRFSPRLTIIPGGFRFRASGQAIILGTLVSFVVALSISGCVDAFTLPHLWEDDGQRVAYVLVIAILSGFLIRIARSRALTALRSGVVIRNLLRTHRLAWEELDSFEERVLPIGLSQVPRRFLSIRFVDGRSRNFTELNDSRRRNPDVVSELVRHLSDMKKSVSDR